MTNYTIIEFDDENNELARKDITSNRSEVDWIDSAFRKIKPHPNARKAGLFRRVSRTDMRLIEVKYL